MKIYFINAAAALALTAFIPSVAAGEPATTQGSEQEPEVTVEVEVSGGPAGTSTNSSDKDKAVSLEVHMSCNHCNSPIGPAPEVVVKNEPKPAGK